MVRALALTLVVAARATAADPEPPKAGSPARTAVPARAAGALVLEGVPRIGYDIRLCPFSGSLASCLEYLGEPVDYSRLMGVTGAAFRRFWNRDDGGNVDLMYAAPEPHRRAFAAVGRDFRTVPVDRAAMLDAIREQLAKRTPVLAFGIIGPPEAGIVTGCSADGDTLYGWSYFQVGERSRYYEQKGWFEALSKGPPFGLITIGDRVAQRRPELEILADSLEWATDLAIRPTRPGVPDHLSGLAACEAWAKALEIDADYPAGDPKTMETRAMVHCDQVVMLHERSHAAAFLRQATTLAPAAAEPLNAAADWYDKVAAHAGQVWRWAHWQDPQALRGLADPATRRQFAQAVRSALTEEEQGVQCLRQALAMLRPRPAGRPLVSHLELQASKLVLYPKGFRMNVEGLPVPSAMRALVEFMGEDFGYSVSEAHGTQWRTNEAFPLFTAVWGDAFEFVWLPKPGLTVPPGPPPVLGDAVARYTATLDAAGFACDVLLRPAAGNPPPATPFPTAAALRQRVVEAIADRGWPVLLLDLPTPGQLFVVTGYDEGGDVLLGWSCEGGDDGIQFAPGKRRAERDWYARVGGAVLLTAKHARPAAATTCRRALEQGLAFLRAREAGTHCAGPATYEAWAQSLDDPTLSARDAATAKRRREILDPMIWDLATRRHYGRVYLNGVADQVPAAAAAELRAATESFGDIHDLMWDAHRTGGGQWPGEDTPKLADPAVRRQVAEILLRARDLDAEAATHIEKALAAMPQDRPQ